MEIEYNIYYIKNTLKYFGEDLNYNELKTID
jgi:hypothetical protein